MYRRQLLQGLSATAIAGHLVSDANSAPKPAPRIVDTHTHFYDPTRQQGVPWPNPGTPLYRPVYPRDWIAVAGPHGVHQTVIVEASGWVEDNQWILDLATNEKSIIGFVGNLSPKDTNFPKHLKRFAANAIYLGIRVSGILTNVIDDPDFRSGIKLLADMGLELDLNGTPAMHAASVRLAKDFPSLRIVVDHVGGAGDANQLTDEWKQVMAALGKHPNVYCKVSALTEQSDMSNRKPGTAPRNVEYYHPILDHCWECFGEDRVIYGSNWPVCEKGGSYSDQFSIVQSYFASKGQSALEKYFWKNAKSAYQWKE
jgi:L-fuconolactonase